MPRELWPIPNPDGSGRWSLYDPAAHRYVPDAINVSELQARSTMAGLQEAAAKAEAKAETRNEPVSKTKGNLSHDDSHRRSNTGEAQADRRPTAGFSGDPDL